jgi:hypothetical protein
VAFLGQKKVQRTEAAKKAKIRKRNRQGENKEVYSDSESRLLSPSLLSVFSFHF